MLSIDSFVWYARKSADASPDGSHEPVLDEEPLESDEEIAAQQEASQPAQAEVTDVPLPTTTDITKASVEQLATLAVSSPIDKQDDKKEDSTNVEKKP